MGSTTVTIQQNIHFWRKITMDFRCVIKVPMPNEESCIIDSYDNKQENTLETWMRIKGEFEYQLKWNV